MIDQAVNSNLNDLNVELVSMQRHFLGNRIVMIAGLLLSSVSAVVAIYYAVSLSERLDDTRELLNKSQTDVELAQQRLSSANDSLQKLQKGAGRSANSSQIDSVIAQVGSGQSVLRSASESLDRADSALPTSRDSSSRSSFAFDCKQAAMPADWVICSDKSLSDQNTLFTSKWITLKKLLSETELPIYRREQMSWIRETQSKCGLPNRGRPTEDIIKSSVQCVQVAYSARLEWVENQITSRR